MRILLVIVIAVVVVGAGYWGVQAFGDGLTGESPEATPTASRFDVRELRTSQRLGNALFEVTPGQVNESKHSEGKRYDIRFSIRNLSDQTSLLYAFWTASVVALDKNGKELESRITLRNAFERKQGRIPVLTETTETMLVVAAEGTEVLQVILTYDEPGGASATANFVWPYGR